MRPIVRGLALACLCGAAVVAAQTPQLLVNLNRQPRTEGSDPRAFTELSPGVVLFIARHPTDGLALYRTDGTGPGTTFVALLSSSSDPSTSATRMLTSGGRAFFVAETPASGVELWVTDGTGGGTTLLVDTAPGPLAGMSRTSGLAAVGSTVFFEGPHDGGGFSRALWQSSGTPAGTQRVTGPEVDLNGPFFTLGSEVFFRGLPGLPTVERRLQKWTGATVATVDPTVVSVQSVEVVNARAWFTGSPLLPDGGGPSSSAIWSTSGTPPFERLPVASSYPGVSGSGFRALGSFVVFSGCTNSLNDAGLVSTDCEPWATDGGAAWQLANISATGQSVPLHFTPLGGRALFTASSTETTRELWTTDGTAAGTSLVRSFQQAPLLGRAGPTRGVVWAADNSVPGLWVTDGTPTGTVLVPGVTTSTSFFMLEPFMPVGNEAWFGCATVGGNEPCRSDGTTGGTFRFANLVADDRPSNPTGFASMPGAAWFVTSAGDLWKTDGTDAGTSRVLTESARPFHFRQPLVSTAAGLSRFADAGLELLTPPPFSPPTSFARVPGGLVFRHQVDATTAELWFTDGTPGGSRRVLSSTAAGITMAATFASATGQGVASPGPGLVFFVADDGSGPQVWRTDGTAAGTQPLSALPPMNLDPTEVAVTWQHVFVVADTDAGTELLAIDRANGGASVIDVASGPASASPFSLTAIGDTVYFAATTPDAGAELWRSNGTAPGTALVFDVNPGPASGLARGGLERALSRVGAALYFAGTTDAGTEPWRSGGTQGTTALLGDVNSGPSSSRPGAFAVAPGRVVFASTDSVGDRELWGLVRDATPPDASLRVVGDAGANGWFTGDVSVQFDWSDPQGSVVTLGDCGGLTVGFDTAGVPFECVVESEGGRVAIGGLVRRDATPPTITCPTVAQAEATSAAGAVVSFTVAASDALDAGLVLALSHDAGPFPVGSTVVTARAVDEAGNTSSCQFSVPVADTRAPDVTCPAVAVSVPAMSDAGSVVGFSVTAVDVVDPTPTITFSQDAGTLFPLGQTLVTATATDDSMNRSTCTVTVVVGDDEPPTITCPSTPVVIAAESAGGAPTPTAFPQVQARDNVVSMPVVTFTRDTGQPLPAGLAVGQTIAVRATASDGRFTASCVFDAVVRDVTPPMINCPSSFSVNATSVEGGLAIWPDPTATDAVDPSVTVRTSEPRGTLFPVGVTTVTATATDDANLEASCRFDVTVVPCADCERNPPALPLLRSQYSFGCTGAAAPPAWLTLAPLAWLLARRRRARCTATATTAVCAALLVASTASAASRPRLAFTGLRGAGVDDAQVQVLSESLQSELAALDFYEVIGAGDIATLLGLERQRQLLGCEATTECMAEVAGALSAERSVAGDVGRVGDTWVLNVSLIDVKQASVVQRARREASSSEALLKQLRNVTYELANADPLRAPLPKLVERAFGGFTVGVRGDFDLFGLGALPGVTGEWSSRWVGVSLTLLIRNLPGVRLEGRFYPVVAGPLRPFIAAGTTAFLTGVAVRGAVGLAVRVWRLQLGLDGAVEYFLNGEQRFWPLAALVGLDVSWAF